MLAADPHVAYISEPLNVHHRPGILRAPVAHWYTYICRENEGDYLPPFRELVVYRYHALAAVSSLRSVRDVLRMVRDAGIFLGGRLLRRRPLLKDPFAAFSLEWFAERLNCQLVVTVRHPAAFASSLKRLNWSFDFKDLLRQPLLMRDYLEPYRELMQSCSPDDIIGQASLLWAMIYHSLHEMRKRLPSLEVICHEELSRDPVAGFKRLYRNLGLAYSAGVERKILDASSSGNPGEPSLKEVHSVRVDSRANLDIWKRRLSSDEIARVRKLTGAAAADYYAETDWN